MSCEEIGGTTTPAPEASLAGAFLSSTCPASPVGVPGDAGAFSGKTPQRWWRRWNAKRLALARHLYANDPRSGEELVAEVNAIDADVLQPVGSWRQLQSHMTYYKVQRHPDANTEALKRRAYTGDAPTIVAIREGAAAGKTFRAIAEALGRSAGTVERLAKQHGITRAARVSEPATPKPKPAKVRPAPVVLHAERRPTQPRVEFQTVEAYLAAGGKITRCPAVAVLPTQAEIPAEDRAAMAAHHKAAEAIGKDWKAQRAAMFRRSKAQEKAIAERNAAAEIARRNAHRSVSEAHRATGNLHWREEKMVGWR